MYDHKKIEAKWQKKWKEKNLYQVEDNFTKEKYYILDMFPYPSGAGLHVGHPKGYIATDIFARLKMMRGFSVLHPMGWDAFGLPAENFALKNKVHPRKMNERNIATFKSQLEKLGFTYDWDKEINTTDPEYYKWTQWIFLQMFKKGLAFESSEPIIWCPSCKTGLAQEDLENGRCERCESEVERKPMRQWVLRITDYADRMLEDLEKLPDWEPAIKEMQKNWIGRSEGALVKFSISHPRSKNNDEKDYLEVFTTRPDTLFGATYMVVAPEHELLKNYESFLINIDEIKKYQKQASAKSDLERTELQKNKTGIKIEGLTAVNPVNKKEIPIYVADYVMMGYGTGAIMAVPAHDERDYEFAKKFGIDIIEVVKPCQSESREKFSDACFSNEGVNFNSEFLDGLLTKEAKEKMIQWLKENNVGQKTVNYKLKDWVFSRQRYWGEPIPIIHCEKCGAVGVPEKDLPVELPDVKHYEPSGTGESPLANIADWVNVSCPECGGPAKRETNTMPQWAGSSWYYLRYIDPRNNEALVDQAKEKYWSPVDLYVGGAEHATRHLIYARFWHKFLHDIGVVKNDEPFKRLQHVGLIMAEDGRKMSKRWGNVINPDDIVEAYGADALRVYEMFMGPFSQSCSWSTSGLVGVRKFLEKVVNIVENKKLSECDCRDGKCSSVSSSLVAAVHKTIKKVGEDIEGFKFNTAISQMMILVNEMGKYDALPKAAVEKLVLVLAPFAPHIAEDLWEKLGHQESIFKEAWPQYNPDKILDETIQLVVQINGKLRDTLEVTPEITEEDAKKIALESEKIKKFIAGKKILRVVFVKGKLVNIVIS